MDNNAELIKLIEVFKGYRDIMTPLQENMQALAGSFLSLKEDVTKLNDAFDSGLNSKFDSISATLEKQSQKSAEMVQTIEKFTRESGKYFNGMSSVLSAMDRAEQKLAAVEELERNAREQIKKLDAIIEDKRVNYNVRDLQRSLENYNVNVKKISDFINKDVAEALTQNAKEIEAIKRENENTSKRLEEEKTTLAELLTLFRASDEMLRSAVEKTDVNEAYIYDMLDKWAASRKLKIKK